MEILPLESNMLGHLAKLYNHAVEPIPYCYPANRLDFSAELAPLFREEGNEDAAEDAQQDDPRHDEAVFVAVEKRRLAGFVHAAMGSPRPGKEPEEGLIRFLWYRPGMREAGDRLLHAAEEHCAALGAPAISVFPQKHRYSFYMMKAAFMSDVLGHVVALLGLRGYARNNGEVFMDWPEFTVAEPGPLLDGLPVDVEHTGGRGRLPGVTVRVAPEGKEIAVCENVSAGEFSRDRLAQEWLFTTWVGVDDEYQGLGLGRWLLQRALWEAQKIGYRHASISTAWENYRALLFYTNFGYAVTNWTYGYRRELNLPLEAESDISSSTE
jgi:GNAT superfamily N-acetyltransferase